jgi:hypothetical protein
VAVVVVAPGGHADLVFGDLVREPALISDPARPIALEPVFERFGLSDPLVTVAFDVLDQCVGPLEDVPVLGLPPQVVAPGVLEEGTPNGWTVTSSRLLMT